MSMFRARTIAIPSIVLLVIPLIQRAWVMVSLLCGLLVLAAYVALAIERETIKSPSFFSQLSLFVIGALMLLSCYLGFGHVLEESAGEDPELIIVIGGFILFPMLSVMGAAMAICSMASKNASHAWLKYLARKPKGIEDDFA